MVDEMEDMLDTVMDCQQELELDQVTENDLESQQVGRSDQTLVSEMAYLMEVEMDHS